MVVFRTGSGSSRLEDSTAAGRAAAEQAVGALGGEAPALVIVYASIRFDLPALLAGVRSVTGDTPLAGSSCSGLFLDGEMIGPDRGVAVLALSAGRYRFATASAAGLCADPYATGRQVTRAAMSAAGAGRPRYAALMLLADGCTGDLQSMLNGVYQVAGAAVPVIGGGASTAVLPGPTYVFHDDRVLSDAAVAVWIGAERPVRVAVGHGWRPQGLPMLVTRTEGHVVHEIAGRPGLEVYRERFHTEGIGDIAEDPEDDAHRNGARPDADASARGEQVEALCPGPPSARAFGLIEPDGRELIRTAFIGSDRLVRTFIPLPPYSAVRLMVAAAEDLLNAGEMVATEALDGAPVPDGGATDPRVLLTFSCAARAELLGKRAGEEAARLQKAAGTVSTFGLYTYGEFTRSTGAPGYHNATIAALAL